MIYIGIVMGIVLSALMWRAWNSEFVRLLRWCLVLTLAASSLKAQTTTQPNRTYWPMPIDTLWIGHQKHTHVSVVGRVAYTRIEDDGDLHIRLNSLTDSAKFVIAECIPALPCLRPIKGSKITVLGISRYDPEHGWREVHPTESWSYTP